MTNVNNDVLLIDTMKIKRFVSNALAHVFLFQSMDRIVDASRFDTHAHKTLRDSELNAKFKEWQNNCKLKFDMKIRMKMQLNEHIWDAMQLKTVRHWWVHREYTTTTALQPFQIEFISNLSSTHTITRTQLTVPVRNRWPKQFVNDAQNYKLKLHARRKKERKKTLKLIFCARYSREELDKNLYETKSMKMLLFNFALK